MRRRLSSARHWRVAWPASALLTGNGIALLLRTPGTEHGDWWSLNGWPVFVAAASVAVLSKYAIRFAGRHVFNPSNFGLVVVFLLFRFVLKAHGLLSLLLGVVLGSGHRALARRG